MLCLKCGEKIKRPGLIRSSQCRLCASVHSLKLGYRAIVLTECGVGFFLAAYFLYSYKVFNNISTISAEIFIGMSFLVLANLTGVTFISLYQKKWGVIQLQ